MEFPQGKSNKQHTVIVILSKRLTLTHYFNLNVVDGMNTFMQTAALFGVRRVPSGIIWAAFSRVVARCFSLIECDPESASVSGVFGLRRGVVFPEESEMGKAWRSL
jgi:hypothetical protein